MAKRFSGRERLKVIMKLVVRDGFKCKICGQVFSVKMREVTLDHIIPVSRGGTSALKNLRLAHSDCNNDRANETRHDGYYEELIICREV